MQLNSEHPVVHDPLVADPDPAILTFPISYTVHSGTLTVQSKLNGTLKRDETLVLRVYDAANRSVHAQQVGVNDLSDNDYTSIDIDVANLPNGVFVYAFEDSSDAFIAGAQFCVLNAARSRVALLHPFFTWHAYCVENGESFYQGRQFDGSKIIELSLKRALRGLSRCHDTCTLRNMSALLDRRGIEHDNFCTLHFHTHPEILDTFDVLIMAGHDEYWTHEQFDALEAFVQRGGHVANFSANVLCWAIDVDGDTMRVDKRNLYEPGLSHRRSSGQFRSPWINRLQQRVFGLNYFTAGYPTERISKARACEVISASEYDASNQITILMQDHPIFEGVTCTNGVLDTTHPKLLDVEVDGVFLKDDAVDRLRTTDVARNIRVLAKALVNIAYARLDHLGRRDTKLLFEKVGIMTECIPYENGGTTVQIGSVGWYKAAEHPASNEARLTTNIVRYLLEKRNDNVEFRVQESV